MVAKKTLKQKISEIGLLNYGFSYFDFIFQDDLFDDDNNTCYGIVDWNNSSIIIDNSVPEKILKVTLLHECLHVVLSTMGIRSDNEDVHVPLSLTNEFITEQTTRGLFLFKELNPDLWELIFYDPE